MAIYCPNKNTDEWKDLVEQYGEEEAHLQWHLKYGAEAATESTVEDTVEDRGKQGARTKEGRKIEIEADENAFRTMYLEYMSDYLSNIYKNSKIPSIDNKFKPDKYNVYHGTDNYEIDDRGNLVLKPAKNFQGKTLSVSFTPVPVVALHYAVHKPGASKYIIRINNNYLPSSAFLDSEEEVAVNKEGSVRISPEGFDILEANTPLDAERENKKRIKEEEKKYLSRASEKDLGHSLVRAASSISNRDTAEEFKEYERTNQGPKPSSEYEKQVSFAANAAEEFLKSIKNRYSNRELLFEIKKRYYKDIREVGIDVAENMWKEGPGDIGPSVKGVLESALFNDNRNILPDNNDNSVQEAQKDYVKKEGYSSIEEYNKAKEREQEERKRKKEEQRERDRKIMRGEMRPEDPNDIPFQKRTGRDQETAENYRRKKELLQNSFAKANINVGFREENIDEGIAYVEPAEEGGTPTVVVDPSKVGEDTVLHEFAHIYIDLLGTQHPVVRQGIEQQKESELWAEVAMDYPDLEQEQFEKEVLATAIGREGFDRQKNPSKFRVWMNKLFNAIAKLFGVERNAARTLADDMWQNKLRTEEFRGEFSKYRQEQREGRSEEQNESKQAQEHVETIDSLGRKVEDLKIMINKLIDEKKDEAIARGKEEELREFRGLYKRLEEVERVEQLQDFFDKALSNTVSARNRIDKLIEKKGELKATDMKEVVELYQYMKKFEVLGEFDDEISKENIDHRPLRDAMNDTISTSREVRSRIIDEVIPAMADVLLQYQGENIEQQLKDELDWIAARRQEVEEGTWSWTSPEKINRKDPDYQKALKQKRQGDISKKQFEFKKLNVYEQQIRDQMPTRKNLISILKKEFTKKHPYSFWVDPIVYSNDQAVQLFAKMVKDELQQVNEESLDTQREIRPFYEQMKKETGRNDNNVSEFYKNIKEKVTVPFWDEEGNRQWGTQLSLVQPYDISSYYKNRETEKDRLAKKYNKPERGQNSAQDIRDWYESEEGKKYRREMGKWYKANTQPVSDAAEQVSEIRKKINSLNTEARKKQEAIDNGDVENEDIAYQEKSDILLEEEMARSELDQVVQVDLDTGKDIYKGRLVKPAEKYRNKKYDDLQDNKFTDAERQMYNKLLEIYQRDQERIDRRTIKNNPWDTYSYITPSVRKRDIDRLQEQGAFTALKDYWKESTQVQSTDTQFGVSINEQGERENQVPIFFTQHEEAENVSEDLVSSFLQFDHMANNFRHKADLQAHATMMQEIIKNRKRVGTDAQGQVLLDQAAKKMDLVREAPPAETDYNLKHLNEFIEMNLYNQQQIREEIAGYELNKAAGLLSSFTAKNTLAFNLLQGANNVMIGRLFGLAEAQGRHLFDKKTLAWSTKEYWAQGAALDDLGKIHADTKLGQLIELYDPIQGETSNMVGHNISGNKLKKSVNGEAFFLLQRGGEHEMHTKTMLAALKYRKARDSEGNIMKDDQGNEMSLYDAYYKDHNDGRVKMVDGVHMKTGDGKVIRFDDRARRNLQAQIHGVNKSLHGVYNDFDKAMMKRRWWGQLVMLFRGWFPSGVRRRWGYGHGVHIDHEMGAVTEGNYITLWRGVREALKNRKMPWSVYNKMSEHEKANARRAATEFGSIAALGVLIAALYPDADDDETNNYVENFMLYQAMRSQAEMFFYSNPSDFYQIMKSPTATNQTIDNVIEFTTQFSEDVLTLSPERYERAAGTAEKGDFKITQDFYDIMPTASGVMKSATPGDAYKWFAR